MSSNLLGLLLLCIIRVSARPPEYLNVDEEVVSTAARQGSFALTSMGQPVAVPSSISASLAAAAASAASGRNGVQVASVPQGGGGGPGSAAAAVAIPGPAPPQATGAPGSASGVAAAATAQQGGGPGGRLVRPNAASIAQEAALEAKAASDAQLMAGQQAAHQVKAQLAERAQQAAQAAQAALVGKQQMMEQLEEEVREAQAVVQEEGASLQMAQQEVQAASASAQQAQQQLKVLTSAVQLEQANVGNAEQAATGAQQELAEKTQLVEAARRRVQLLLSQLSAARSDFTNTRQAADRALQAAQEAKINAARSRRAQPLSRREALDVKISAPSSQKHSTSMVPPPILGEDERKSGKEMDASSRGMRSPVAEDAAQTEAALSGGTADDSTSAHGSSNVDQSTGDGDGTAASEGITKSATGVGDEGGGSLKMCRCVAFTEDASLDITDDVTHSFTEDITDRQKDIVNRDDATQNLVDGSETTVQIQRERRHVTNLRESGRSFFSKFLPSRLIHHSDNPVSLETQNLKKANSPQGIVLTESIQNGVNENTKESRSDGTSSFERNNLKPHSTDDEEWGQHAESVQKKKGKRRRTASVEDTFEEIPAAENRASQRLDKGVRLVHGDMSQEDSADSPDISNTPLRKEIEDADKHKRIVRKSDIPENQVTIFKEKNYMKNVHSKNVPIQNKLMERPTRYDSLVTVISETDKLENDDITPRNGFAKQKFAVHEQISKEFEATKLSDADVSNSRKRRNLKIERYNLQNDKEGRNNHLSTDSTLVRRQRESYSTPSEEANGMYERTRNNLEITENQLNINDATQKATESEGRKRPENLESFTKVITSLTDQMKRETMQKRSIKESLTEYPENKDVASRPTSIRIIGGNSGSKHSKVNERYHREVTKFQYDSMSRAKDLTKRTVDKTRFQRLAPLSQNEQSVSQDHATRVSKTEETIQHVIPELQSEPPGGENYVTKETDQKERRERQILEAPTEQITADFTDRPLTGEWFQRESGDMHTESNVDAKSMAESAFGSKGTARAHTHGDRLQRDVIQKRTDKTDEENIMRQSRVHERTQRAIPKKPTKPSVHFSDAITQNKRDIRLSPKISESLPNSVVVLMDATTEGEIEKRELREIIDVRTEQGVLETSDLEGTEANHRNSREISKFPSLEDNIFHKEKPKRVKKELDTQKEGRTIEGDLTNSLFEKYPSSITGLSSKIREHEGKKIMKDEYVQERKRRDDKHTVLVSDDTKQTKKTQKREVKECNVMDQSDRKTGTKIEKRSEQEITEVTDHTSFDDDAVTEDTRPARGIIDTFSDITEYDVTTDNLPERNRREMTDVQTQQTVFIKGFRRHTKVQDMHERESDTEYNNANKVEKIQGRHQREVQQVTKDKKVIKVDREKRNVESSQNWHNKVEKEEVKDSGIEEKYGQLVTSEIDQKNLYFPANERIKRERGRFTSEKQNCKNDFHVGYSELSHESQSITRDPSHAYEQSAGNSMSGNFKERLNRDISGMRKACFEKVSFLSERQEDTLEHAASGFDSIALLGGAGFNREVHGSKFGVIKRGLNKKDKLSTTFDMTEDITETNDITSLKPAKTVTYASGGSMLISGLPQELIALNDCKGDPESSNTHRRVKRNRRDTAMVNTFYFNAHPEAPVQTAQDNQNSYQYKGNTMQFSEHPISIRKNTDSKFLSDQEYFDSLNIPLLNSKPGSDNSKPEKVRDVIGASERSLTSGTETLVNSEPKGRKSVSLEDLLMADPWGTPDGRVFKVENR